MNSFMLIFILLIFSMWACSICAASYERKGFALRHIKYQHDSNQMVQVIFIPNSISSSVSTPTSPVENDPFEDNVNLKTLSYDVTNHTNIQNITRQDLVVLKQNDSSAAIATCVPSADIDKFEDEAMKNIMSDEVTVNVKTMP